MRHLVLAAVLTVATATAVNSGPVLADVVFVKKKPDDAVWTPRETPLLDEDPGLTSVEIDARSRFGGWSDKRFSATGFFRTEKQGQEWWLVDPEGYAFFSVGLNAVEPGVEATAVEPQLAKRFDAAFPSVNAWALQTGQWLNSTGFNTLGSWSDWRQLNDEPSVAVPYTEQLHLLSRYIWNDKRPRLGENFDYRWTHYHLFDPEFLEYCRKVMAEVATRTRNDPFLVGYFTDNELGLRLNQLDSFLKLEQQDPVRRDVVTWLENERGLEETADGTLDVRDDDRIAFYKYLADTYYRTVTKAIREADPNHLVLGDRYNWDQEEIGALWEAAAPYVDVFSFNWYDVWNPNNHATIDNWARWADRPVIITEWYAKGMDTELPNKTGAGWVVRDQEARGKYYETFALGLLDQPSIVGFHWFRYRDNNPDAGKYVDASNLDSNKGLVDVDYQPYAPLVDRARRINERVYDIRQRLLTRRR